MYSMLFISVSICNPRAPKMEFQPWVLKGLYPVQMVVSPSQLIPEGRSPTQLVFIIYIFCSLSNLQYIAAELDTLSNHLQPGGIPGYHPRGTVQDKSQTIARFLGFTV